MDEKSSDDFNQFAGNYRELHTENIKITGADSLYFAEHKVKELERLESNSRLKFLDIGCGDGAVELFVSRYFSQWSSAGIDISDKSIHEARSKSISNSEFLVFDGEKIPFPDSSFDITFFASVLHHVPEEIHDLIILEAMRVLKPGGRIYIFEHNPANPFTRHIVKTCVFDKNVKLLWPGYTRKLLKKAGFKSITSKFILFFPRWKVFSGIQFLEKGLAWLPVGGQYFFRAVKED
ncbi:MAG: hypothetical protein C5B52_07670 [Bacteroidetes bacterium]|nr:MAG: hypothetical protein C5B52_07670 [Bacteroidota bacterium]